MCSFFLFLGISSVSSRSSSSGLEKPASKTSTMAVKLLMEDKDEQEYMKEDGLPSVKNMIDTFNSQLPPFQLPLNHNLPHNEHKQLLKLLDSGGNVDSGDNVRSGSFI